MAEPKQADTWAGTIDQLRKLEGRDVMGSQRLMPGAYHGGKAKPRDEGLAEAHLGSGYGRLLD